MALSLSLEKWKAVLSKDAEIARLLNVIDEQDFLQEHMSSASLKECIEGGGSNLERVKLVIRSIIMDDNVGLYNALCGYFLERSEDYKNMYEHFSGIDRDTYYDKYTQLAVLKEQVHQLTEELKYWRENEQPNMNERLDGMQKDFSDKSNEMKVQMGELKKKMEDWMETESATVQQLQASLKSVKKPLPPRPFPDPYSDEMRKKVVKENLSCWKKFGLVPFLCDENGEYFVDWENNDEQWKFGKFGRNNWNSSDNEVQCSLLLPRQFTKNGLKNIVVHIELYKDGTFFCICMTHFGTLSENVPLTKFKCRFQVSIPFNDGTPSIELRKIISCQVENIGYEDVFTSDPIPSLALSNQLAPSIRLTLTPP